MRSGCSLPAVFVLVICILLTCVACNDASDNTDTTATTVVTTVKTTAPVPSEGYITADSMRVRGGPGLTYEVIGGITAGERVEIIGKTGDWYHIRFGDTVGYISGQYISFTAPHTAS